MRKVCISLATGVLVILGTNLATAQYTHSRRATTTTSPAAMVPLTSVPRVVQTGLHSPSSST
jgi:hypothetical protein